MSVVPDSNEPISPVDLTSTVPAPAPAPAHPETESAARDSPRVQVWVNAVGAAFIAAFLAWGVGEKMYGYYRPKATASSRDFRVLNREERIAEQKNTAVAFGVFGAILGMLSGVAGGASRRSILRSASAALAGILLGGVGSALASYELAPIFARFYSDETPSLLLPFLVRGGIWSIVGLSAGLVLGWGWQGFPGIPRGLVGGLAGGVCGTIAFELLNAVLFPGDRNDAVIPSSMPARLLAYLFVAIGVAWGAVLFGRSSTRPERRTPSKPVMTPELSDRARE
jgi:hypothetical protein